mgnify:CR=1 FL=1
MSAMVTLKHENGLKQNWQQTIHCTLIILKTKNAIKIIHHGLKNKTSQYVADEKYTV